MNIILTTMTLVKNQNQVLIQNRTKKDWPGYTLPGGKVKGHETIEECAIREVKEETGLDIKHLKMVNYIEWVIENERHLCILFETNTFSGELISSDEGENLWLDINQIKEGKLSTDFDLILDLYKLNWR